MIVLSTRRVATAAAFAVGITMGAPLAWGFQPADVFQLDGDALTDPVGGTPTSDDWQNILAGSSINAPLPTSNAPAAEARLIGVTRSEPCPADQVGVSCIPEDESGVGFAGLIGDPASGSIDQIFITGGGKDTNDLTSWLWKFATPSPDKDNILHAFAAAYVLGSNFPSGANCPSNANFNCQGDLVIYFGLDRLSNSGEADTGFWFLQSAIATTPTTKSKGGNTFATTGHVAGDLLVQIDYPQSAGATPNARVVVWDPTVAGNLRVIAGGPGGSSAVCDASDQVFCAIANNSPQPAGANQSTNISSMGTSPSPWPYVPKSVASDCNTTTFPTQGVSNGCFPAESFFEGAINLSRAFRIAGIQPACITGFVAETRSSASFTSSLQDFVVSNFNLCKISITKLCDPTTTSISMDETTVTWGFKGMVTNSGFGTLYNVQIFDVPTGLSETPVTTIASLGPNVTANYSGTYQTPAQTSHTDFTRVAAAPSSAVGAPQTVTDSSDSGGRGLTTCSVSLPGALQVTKNCVSTTLEVVPGAQVGNSTQLVVTADVSIQGTVCNTGSAILTGVKVDDLTLNKTWISGLTLNPPNMGFPAGSECANYSGSYVPTTDDLVNGAFNPNPKTASFTDKVKASGTDKFDGTSVSSPQAQATCPLCQ